MKVYDCQDPTDRDRGVAAAAGSAKRGELVVLPTDARYGLGCDAFKRHAVSALFRAKDRGRDLPLVVMVGSRRTFDGLVHRMPKAARALADAFWPGPLTLIVQQARSLNWDLGDTDGTVAVRMPLHPVALEVLREVGPMATTPAGKTGSPAAVTVADAQALFGSSARVYLDGGPAPDPPPSTIVDLTAEVPQVVRVGGVPLEQLQEVVPELLAPPGPDPGAGPGSAAGPATTAGPQPGGTAESAAASEPEPVAKPAAVNGPAGEDGPAGEN